MCSLSLVSWLSLGLLPASIFSQGWPSYEYNNYDNHYDNQEWPSYNHYDNYPAASPAEMPASYSNTVHPALAQEAGADEVFMDQYIYLVFGPAAVVETIQDSEWDIKDVLSAISKIDSQHWWLDYTMPISMDPAMNAFIEVMFRCTNNAQTQEKILSLKAMIDYDKEMFMLLFNTMFNEKGRDDIYITDIYDNSYFMDIQSQSGVLSQQNAQDKEDQVLGHGMLYTMMDNVPGLFCNDTWGWTETLVACRTMGYDFGIYLDGAYETIPVSEANSAVIKYTDVQCSGYEESIWDCPMMTHDTSMPDVSYPTVAYPSSAPSWGPTLAPNTNNICSDWRWGVAVYCTRFVSVEGRFMRALKRHDSYDDFMPIVWGPYHYDPATADVRNTMAPICYGDETPSLDLAGFICDKWRNGDLSGGNMASYTSSDDYWWGTPSVADYDGFAQVNSLDVSMNWIEFRMADDPTCYGNTKALAISCGTDYGCVEPYGECATDLDCCQSADKRLFCHPRWGNCVDIRSEQKPDGYSPCYSHSECKSGNCFSPGIWGRCSAAMSAVDMCSQDDRCFRDDQCCEGYVCNEGSCHQDEWNGQTPQFWNIDGGETATMYSAESYFDITGSGFRPQMLFKLSVDGTCWADRSPVSNVPSNSYAEIGYSYGDGIGLSLKVYSMQYYGRLELCYAVNDYADYESTGLSIRVPRFVNDNDAASMISASVSWSAGFSNVLHEDADPGYTEYYLTLSRPLLSGEYISLDMFWDEWSNLMFPRTSWFYHQDKSVSESMRFVYDDNGADGMMPGYRDSSNWNTPIKVRLEWDNNGYPEIMDREFYLIHTINGQLGNHWVDRYRIADILFTMIDDDPHVVDSSLRREGEGAGDGVAHIDGYRTGYEGLVFTCVGCGSDEMTGGMRVNYGEETDKHFYMGQDLYISTTMDYETYEITASYVNFFTEYIPYEDAPSENLVFEISVASRFDAAHTAIISPDFSFSYPGNIDTTIPFIEKIVGEGCDQDGKKAINCPTDGKYNGDNAKIVLYGTLFPDTILNTTVEITIDGVTCRSVQWWIEEDPYTGLRNASCEFGAGVSAHGTNGFSNVQLSYERHTIDGMEYKMSDPVKYFNYAPPAVTEVVGCPNTESVLHTTNCSRVGGGVEMIRVIGSNFGPSGSRVFIGGGEALQTLHDAQTPHSLLWVTYGPGTRESEKILVMNAYGGTSDTEAFISYEQCRLGWRQKRSDEVPTEEHLLQTDPNQGFRCVICEPGTYSNALNSETCFECDAGKFQSLPGQTSCESCEAGTFSASIASSNCTDCPPGEFASTTGASACTPCNSGQFTSVSRSSVCGSCNENSDSIAGQRDQCLCAQGYYTYAEEEDPENSDLQRPLCRECSEGMVCDRAGLNDSEVWPMAGYMPMIHTTPETRAMMECPTVECIGGNGTGCSEHYTGWLCTDCDVGYGKAGAHKCDKCPEPGLNALRLVGVAILIFLVIIVFIRMTIKAAEAVKSDLSTIGKIAFSFVQFNSLALQFDYEFPPAVDGFLTVQEVPGKVVDSMMSIDCFVKESDDSAGFPSIYIKSILYLVTPLIILVLCRVVFAKVWCVKETEFDKTTPLRRRNSSLNELTRMELPEDSKAKAYVEAWNHYITAVIISIFMIHPNITQMTADLLNCRKLGALDDDYYLIADMTAQCYNKRHWIFVLAVAVPMGVFTVFGLPLFVLYRLCRNKDELAKPFHKIAKNLLNRYHFLIKGYEPRFYYWEIIIE